MIKMVYNSSKSFLRKLHYGIGDLAVIFTYRITCRFLSEYSQSLPLKGPLSGIRVLDMTRILAGPFCSMILGDLGADIIKVEHPENGDETRNWGPPFVNGQSAYFLSVNRNKKSIAIDMKKAEGQDLIRKLAVKSDIFLENFIPGKLNQFGLGYENLQTISPQLIYCSITGYGPSGPYSSRPGYDVIAASVGGLIHITGPEDGIPCKVGVAMTDLATGLYAHGAIMAALLQRFRTGKGQKIDCDLLSTQVSLLANIGSNYLNAGQEAKRWGTAHESIVPYQSFKTKDGYLTIGAASNKQFETLCQILNVPELLNGPKFATNEARVQNREEVVSKLTEIFLRKSSSNWMELLAESGMPCGPVNNMKEVFSDPQVIHNKLSVDMVHSTAGSIKVIGPAVQYSSIVNQARSPPPCFAEHTDSILADVLSYDKEKIECLRKSKVIL